jgi:integrase
MTLHGFRSSFRQWAAEKTNFPDHIAEQALAHATSSGVEKAYKRKAEMFDRRRKLMEAWARHCCTPPVEAAAVVVPLRAV